MKPKDDGVESGAASLTGHLQQGWLLREMKAWEGI